MHKSLYFSYKKYTLYIHISNFYNCVAHYKQQLNYRTPCDSSKQLYTDTFIPSLICNSPCKTDESLHFTSESLQIFKTLHLNYFEAVKCHMTNQHPLKGKEAGATARIQLESKQQSAASSVDAALVAVESKSNYISSIKEGQRTALKS